MGDLSLPEFIIMAKLLCDQCEYLAEAKDKLLHDATIIRMKPLIAYSKCIEKGGDLAPLKVLDMIQSKDLAQCQIDHCRLYQTTIDVHKFGTQQHKHQQKGNR